jgi:hypothetical protein
VQSISNSYAIGICHLLEFAKSLNVLMNASWAAAFGAPLVALCMLLLLPLSIWLAKAFAVT